MGLKREIAKANVFYTFSRVLSAIIGFFFSIIMARLLQPHNFGLYSFALVVVSFFVIFTDFGFDSALIRFFASYFSKGNINKSTELARFVFKLRLVLTLGMGVFISLFSNQISNYIFNKPEASFIVLLAGFLLIFNSMFNFFGSLFSALKDFKFFALLQISQNLLKLVFAAFLVIIGFEVFGAIAGTMLSFVSVIAISIFLLQKKYRFLFSGQNVSLDKRGLISFSLWIFAGGLIGTIFGLIDQLMISIMLPVEDIGFYRIALSWRYTVSFLVPITGFALYPYLSASVNKKQVNSMIFNSIRYVSIFIFPLAFLLSAYSKPLILFLYKEPFLPVVPALAILAFLSIFTRIGVIITSYFNSIKRPDVVTKVILFTMILNAVLNWFLIQIYGITGAAIASLISGGLSITILFLIAIFIYKITFKSRIILKPLISALITYFASLQFLPYVTNYFTLALYGSISILMYLAIMLLIKGIAKEDIEYFKKGVNMVTKRIF